MLQDFGLVLPRLQQLRRLHLEVMHLEMLPGALVQGDHLTELRLEHCSLPGDLSPATARLRESILSCLAHGCFEVLVQLLARPARARISG